MADGAGLPDASWSSRMAGLDARLLLWLSPGFPVGAYAFSHGLEQAVERGWLTSAAALEAWLRDIVQLGSLRNDLVLVVAAWQAVQAKTEPPGDRPMPETGMLGCSGFGLGEINGLALALQPSAERHLESRSQGNAFLSTILAAWPCSGLADVRRALISPQSHLGMSASEGQTVDVAYPVAVGAVAAAHDIGLDAVLLGYGLAFAGNLVSAAIRLSVIGQTDGQRVLAALLADLDAAAADAATATLDDLGNATLRSDITQLAHETQYSRLFRS
jgi:urease accessory protein